MCVGCCILQWWGKSEEPSSAGRILSSDLWTFTGIWVGQEHHWKSATTLVALHRTAACSMSCEISKKKKKLSQQTGSREFSSGRLGAVSICNIAKLVSVWSGVLEEYYGEDNSGVNCASSQNERKHIPKQINLKPLPFATPAGYANLVAGGNLHNTDCEKWFSIIIEFKSDNVTVSFLRTRDLYHLWLQMLYCAGI